MKGLSCGFWRKKQGDDKKQRSTTTIKLVNTNKNNNKIFSLVYCDDIYQHNFSSMYPSVNTNRKILLVYTKGITVGK